MSVRIGLYDFFAYTIPGTIFLLATAIAMFELGLLPTSAFNIQDLSLYAVIVLIGAGYLIGNLMDILSSRWSKLLISKNRLARHGAYKIVEEKYRWLKLGFDPDEWAMLLWRLKSESTELASDIEQHNVAFIMLRNVSLGLLLLSIEFVLIYLFSFSHWGNLILGLLFGWFSFLAIRGARLRRYWFYKGLFEAFAAQYMMSEKIEHNQKFQAAVHQAFEEE